MNSKSSSRVKTFFVLGTALIALAMAGSVYGEETNDIRIVNGKAYNLKILKEWLKTDEKVRPPRRPLERWDKISGLRFLAEHKEGTICEGYFTREQIARAPLSNLQPVGQNLDVLIKNFAEAERIKQRNGSPVTFAFDCGFAKQIQINGKTLQVWVWDYGNVPKSVKPK